MSDPSLLVTNPSRTDPTVAPPGRQSYYVLAPAPNLERAPLDWRNGLDQRYAESLVATLDRRGYRSFADGIEVQRVISPADWADQGLAAGTPFASAHTFGQTGPFRPGNLHPSLPNVVFTGSGTQPGVGVPMVLISGKLAAARITAGAPAGRRDARSSAGSRGVSFSAEHGDVSSSAGDGKAGFSAGGDNAGFSAGRGYTGGGA